MNSLLQVFYMTPELRAGLFNVAPMELGFTEVIFVPFYCCLYIDLLLL